MKYRYDKGQVKDDLEIVLSLLAIVGFILLIMFLIAPNVIGAYIIGG